MWNAKTKATWLSRHNCHNVIEWLIIYKSIKSQNIVLFAAMHLSHGKNLATYFQLPKKCGNRKYI